MRINQNISAMNTYSRLNSANAGKSNSLAKLSSGLRINKAGDDAAGLAISEKMRGQVGGLKQAVRNAQDGISLIQTAEGALNETHSILQRMRELSVQSANGTNTGDDRKAIQDEVDQLAVEIDRISSTTKFNKQGLLDGTFDGTFQIGANKGESLSLSMNNMSSAGLNVGGTPLTEVVGDDTKVLTLPTEIDGETLTKDALTPGKYKVVDTSSHLQYGTGGGGLGFDRGLEDVNGNLVGFFSDTDGDTDVVALNGKTILSMANAGDLAENAEINIAGKGIDITDSDSISKIDSAIEKVSAERSKLGATQNRLDHTINNLTTTAENLSAAESRIRDVDMAEEMMEFTKNNILSQAATSMLAQANQMPQSVLQLLQ